MGVSQWWLYDLVVIAIAVLCIWNGLNGSILKSFGSLIIVIVSCVAAGFFSAPVSEIVYNTFFKDNMQTTISEKLGEIDVTDNIRAELESNGIYLPFDDGQIADIIDGVRRDDSSMQQAAAAFRISKDQIEEELENAVNYALKNHNNIVPDWAAKAIASDDSTIKIDAAADIVVAMLRDDYSFAASEIENAYVKPIVLGLLRTIVFVCISALFVSIFRTVLLVLPNKRKSISGTIIGASLGAAKAALYLYLLVLLVGCISSMQKGMYPFYSDKTINQTYLFRIFYDMWQ